MKKYFKYTIRLLIVAAALAIMVVGIVQGDWGETMTNAIFL